MQKFENRFKAWREIGSKLADFVESNGQLEDEWSFGLLEKVNRAVHHNGWFERAQVMHALTEWSKALSEESLKTWVSNYPESHFNPSTPKKVGLVMAGNIPLVGFHDLLTVHLTGHIPLVKMSSDDNQLIPAILFGSLILEDIQWVERLNDMEAVIATGSDNTARYFEHYFGKYPNIIRKNRKSLAVLTGDETEEDLEALGEDVFRYFGMGCRSVSKIYLPEDFNLDKIFGSWLPYQEAVQNHKYANNYDYHRAILLLDRKPFLENGFVIMREHEHLATPVGTVHYERYTNQDEVWNSLKEQRDSIQCIASNSKEDSLPVVELGQTQSPSLWDYADGVDTVEFLAELH